MIHSSVRTLAVAIGLAAAVSAAAPAPPGAEVLGYDLTPETRYTKGCSPPCACPSVEGTPERRVD